MVKTLKKQPSYQKSGKNCSMLSVSRQIMQNVFVAGLICQPATLRNFLGYDLWPILSVSGNPKYKAILFWKRSVKFVACINFKSDANYKPCNNLSWNNHCTQSPKNVERKVQNLPGSHNGPASKDLGKSCSVSIFGWSKKIICHWATIRNFLGFDQISPTPVNS